MGKVLSSAGVACAILLASALLSPAVDKLWTGAVSTDWIEPNNWDPPGVPQPQDTAFLNTNGLIYMASEVAIHGINLSAATLDGPGNLTVTNFNWTNGFLRGGGTCTIPAEGILRLELSGPKDLHRNFVNFGTVIQEGRLYMTATFHNAGVFDMRGDVNLSGYQGLFKNVGLFSKSAGLRTNTISIPFDNRGEMRLLSGTLRFTHAHTNEGIVNISESAAMEVANFPVVAASCSLEGSGTLRFFGGFLGPSMPAIGTTILTTNSIHPKIEIFNFPPDSPSSVGRPTLTFDSAVCVRECLLDGGGISGTNAVTITNLLWAKGWFGGTGTLVIPPGGSLMVTGVFSQYYFPKHVSGRTLINYGNIEWRDSGTIDRVWTNPGLLLNRGTFRALGDGDWRWESINEGVIVRSSGAGLCAINLATNYGLVEVQSGTLAAASIQLAGETYLNGGNFYGGYGLQIYGGTIRGSGIIVDSPYAGGCGYYTIANYGGDIRPGNPFGRLTINGNFRQSSLGRLVIEIAGTNAGVDFDEMVITNDRVDAWFDGLLSITVTNGFRPALGDRFEIMKYLSNGSCPVTFRNFPRLNGTDLGGGLILLPDYSPTNIVLVVTNVPATRFYVTKNPVDPRPRVRFHGSPATNYVLQGSTTLTNWIDLFINDEPIDLIDYVNDYWDYWRYTGYRFYRVRWG